jgi:hypothetical protein
MQKKLIEAGMPQKQTEVQAEEKYRQKHYLMR